MNALLTIGTLWQREIVRFYRQPSRIVGAVGSPLIFWLLIGSGIGNSFEAEMEGGRAIHYLEYFFPGTLLMIVLFTAIFSTFSIIEDRREGFLQSVLVAPVPRFSIVFGKIAGGATLAVLQAVLLLAVTPFLGLHLTLEQWMGLLFSITMAAFSLTALGFSIAWQMHSIQGFHAVMNLFLLPLWLLSGALFPEEGALPWIQWIMRFNPLTYELRLMRESMYQHGPEPLSLAGTVIFTVLIMVIATLGASQRNAKNVV